jgi:hypothetical protein
MKYILFTSIFLFVFGFKSHSQKYNSELLKSYSKEELQNFDSETIKVLEYGLENAVYYAELPSNKGINFNEIVNESNSLRYTDFRLKIAKENQYFRIKNSNKMMVVKSMFVLKNELSIKK